MADRPTLVEQLADRKRREEISKLSREELIGLLIPHTPWQHIDFWLFLHLPLIHTLIWWTICWIYPFDTKTSTRHWRWNKEG